MKKTPFLFIDDSAMDNFYIEALIEIEKLPIKAHFSKNAIDALAYLRSLKAKSFPYVIISDIHMPMMTGVEFVRQFEKEFLSKFPETLLFLTSAIIRSSQTDLLKKGSCVQGLIEKPFMKGHFEKTIVPLLFPSSLIAS